MKVLELIQELQKLPEDAEIYVQGMDHSYMSGEDLPYWDSIFTIKKYFPDAYRFEA